MSLCKNLFANKLEILPDRTIKINDVTVSAKILSLTPGGLPGQFLANLEMLVMLTAAPPEYDFKELGATGQVVIKS